MDDGFGKQIPTTDEANFEERRFVLIYGFWEADPFVVQMAAS